MKSFSCGHSDNFAISKKIPPKLIKKKIMTIPCEIKDFFLVRWRKNRRARDVIAKSARFSIIIKRVVSKKPRRNAEVEKMKTAAHSPAKDMCNLSFLPVRIRERQIIKLVPARVNISID